MDSAESWVDTLTKAALAAFICRDVDGVPTIVERTPDFIDRMNMLTGRLDEHALLERLAQVWPPDLTAGPLVVRAGEALDSRCVIDTVDDGDYLVLFTAPDGGQVDGGAFYEMVEDLPDIISRHDDQMRHIYVNHAIDRAVAPLTRDDYIDKTHHEVGETEEFIEFFQGLHKQVFANRVPVESEFDYPVIDGGFITYLVRIVPEFGVDGVVRTVLSTCRDISEVKRLQRRFEALSATDALTGLLNRRSFCDRLDVELQRVVRGEAALSMLLLDVDNLKVINDRHGHAAGDAVLTAIGDILAEQCGPDDLAARLGGDEFCLALIGAGLTDAQPVAEGVRTRIAGLHSGGEHPVQVSVSVGLAAATATDRSAPDLIGRVDQLMYQAKLAGKNHVVCT